jgi:CRP-like cAMP-binding protein
VLNTNLNANRLLALLPPATLEAITTPYLKLRDLPFGTVVAETQGPMEEVFFPHTGVVSLVVELQDGGMLETAMIGRDGAVGIASALDGKLSLNKAIVQIAGTASVIKAEKLRDFALSDQDFHSRLIRHEQVLFAAVQQSAACNASHTVEARLCRWLLRMRDLAGDDLSVTQEFLGQMLGVRRTSVSLVAGTLQAANLIRYRRGHVRIVDVDGLKEAACECYETVNAHYDLLFHAK